MAVSPVKQTEQFIKRSLKFLDNVSIRWGIIIFLVLYAVLVVPNFPFQVTQMFHNPLVQGVFLLVIVYVGVKDLGVALTLALAFVVSLFMARRGNLFRGPRMALQTEQAALEHAGGMLGGVAGPVGRAGGAVLGGAGDVVGRAGDVVGQAGDVVGDVLQKGQQVASVVLGTDIVGTARELTGNIMDGGDDPEGYNSTVTCFRSCNDIIPLQGKQCTGTQVWGEPGDVQGLQCPEQGWAALPPGAPTH